MPQAPKASHSYGVTLLRVSEFAPREPVLYEPSAVFVIQGSKHGFVGAKSVIYDANNYLVLSVPLPFECETKATPDCPMLAIYVRMRREVIAELVTSMRWESTVRDVPPATIEAAPLNERMSGNLLRLLEAMQSPTDEFGRTLHPDRPGTSTHSQQLRGTASRSRACQQRRHESVRVSSAFSGGHFNVADAVH